jgi:hypothetical protein
VSGQATAYQIAADHDHDVFVGDPLRFGDARRIVLDLMLVLDALKDKRPAQLASVQRLRAAGLERVARAAGICRRVAECSALAESIPVISDRNVALAWVAVDAGDAEGGA